MRSEPVAGTAVRALWLSIAVMLPTYVVWLLVEPQPVLLRDLVLYTVLLGACCGLVLLRALGTPEERTAWLIMGAGLVVWTTADALYTVLAAAGPVPFPSVADWGYLAFFPFAYVAVGLMVVRCVVRGAMGVWLDGVLVALGAGALLSLFVPRLADGLPDSPWSLFMQFATPASDLLLVSGLIGVVSLLGRRTPAAWWALLGAASFLWATDSLWLVGVAHDQYRVGVPLDLGWLLAFLLFAAAAWLPIPERTQIEDRSWSPVAAVVGIASFLLLLYATQNQVPIGSVLLAAGAVVIGLWRAAQTMRAASAYQQARRQAERDELTGLANRRRLTRELGDDRMVGGALLLIDIDGFKWINDSLGHEAGDEVLRQLAPRLRGGVGADDLVVRLGGDEFAVFLPGIIEPEAAFVSAEGLRQAVARPMTVSDIDLEIDLSIGVAIAPRDAQELSGLLRAADGAMYRAKRSRMGSSLYEPGDTVTDHSGQLLRLQELRHAIADGQLTCVYQPKVELRTGRVTGMEALLRWHHPERGEILPGRFLPFAEHTAVIRPLTMRALDVALAQAAAWQRDGFGVTVSVNLSATNLLDPRLQASVMERLTKHGVAPGRLMLEVTESVFVEDPERAARVIAELTDLGVRLSVDDYGTGFSSLGQIQNVATEELKLDSSFVIGVAERSDLQAIVSATVLLAHGLGLTLVAEGVETAADLDMITRLGVDQAQGFFLCPPLAASDASHWLHRRVALPHQRTGAHTGEEGGLGIDAG